MTRSTMNKFNISGKLIETIQSLYENAMSAVLVQGTTGEWLHTSVGVRQGCLLSPTLFNTFLEDIMTHALENFNGTISIGGLPITNLRFADDIDGITLDPERAGGLARPGGAAEAATTTAAAATTAAAPASRADYDQHSQKGNHRPSERIRYQVSQCKTLCEYLRYSFRAARHSDRRYELLK